MSKLRTNLIKVFAVVFAVCTAFAIAFMPKTESVDAATGSFKILGTSIRVGDDGYTGLKYEFNLNKEWYQENASGKKMAVGTLIFPAYKDGQLQQVDTSKSPTDNMQRLDGDNFILREQYDKAVRFDKSILFDDQFIEQAIIDKYKSKGITITADEIDEGEFEVVKKGLYAKEFTAYPYVIIEGKTVWGDAPYTTSMQKVAAQTLVSVDNDPASDPDGKIKTAAKKYLGLVDVNNYYYDGYVSVEDNKVVIDGIDGYQVNDDAIVALGNDNATVANGEIILNGTLTASKNTQKLFIFEEGTTKIIDLLLVDNVISTDEELLHYFDYTSWAEGENPFSKVTVLANDIDMCEIGMIYGTEAKAFNGVFDGRGHVISNLIKAKSIKVDGNAVVYNGLFGNMRDNCIIRNVAFEDITSVGYNVNNGLISTNLRGTFENVYVKFSTESDMQQLFAYLEVGTMQNVIIEAPYEDGLDVKAWIVDHAADWGRTYLGRLIDQESISTINNVKVISQRPLITYGEGKLADPVDSVDKKTGAPKTDWKNWFAYGENETAVWHDFAYFHDTNKYGTFAGLGLPANDQRVDNTQVIVDGQSRRQGKTRVLNGVERYNTYADMVDGQKSLDAFTSTGMWKVVDGELLWNRGDNTINRTLVKVTSEVDYNAYTNQLLTTEFNGENVNKVIVGNQILTVKNGGIIKNGDGSYNFRAKTSYSDNDPGVPYVENIDKSGYNNASSFINYDELEFVVYTDDFIYTYSNVYYYTRLIGNLADLKQALGYDVNYTAGEVTGDIANVTDREAKYNGKGFKVVTALDGKYYENVYNVGVYKLTADIDMKGAGIDYENNTLDGANLGGYAALLDGAGYSIKNFVPGTQGLLGSMNSYVRGSNTDTSYQTSSGDQLNKRSIPFTPTIKNIAFEDVITTIDTPVIAISAGFADAFVPRPPVIENIYVTVSSESTGSSGIIRNVNSHVKTNNVYIVNNNDFDNFITLDNKFEFTTRDGAVTTPSDGKYFNPVDASAYRDSALFGKINGNNVSRVLNSVSYTTNVYVVSKLPLTAYARRMADYYGYFYIDDTENKLPKIAMTYLGGYVAFKVGTASRNAFASYGFGANETVSRIPVVYDYREVVKTEYHTYYDAGLASSNKTWGMTGFFCSVCGKVTIAKETNGVVNKDKGKCLMTENCTGTLVVNAGTGGSGFWGSPIAYVWTTVNPVTEAGTDFALDNGNFRFKTAYKYESADLMPQGEENYASFLGTAGNGMWGLDSDNRLVWVGAQPKT